MQRVKIEPFKLIGIGIRTTNENNMDLNRAYTADFEVFGEKSQNPSNAEVDFYVAIKE